MFGEQTFLFGRFCWYPPCPRPDLVLGVFPHTDGSGLTVLLPEEEVEGLHFLKDDQWCRVPVIPEAFVVNVGDQLEVINLLLTKIHLWQIKGLTFTNLLVYVCYAYR